MNSSRWIISHATSSHPDLGPDLIAVRIDERTVSLLRDFLISLHKMVTSRRAMTRLQWMGAHIEFLREADDENNETRCMAGLNEGTAIILPPDTDLPQSCLYDREFRAEYSSFTMLHVSERFDPEVFSTARIKHIPIEIESKIDLWPLIETAFPAPQPVSEHHYDVIVRGCAPAQADSVITERLDPDENLGFPYTLQWSRKQSIPI